MSAVFGPVGREEFARGELGWFVGNGFIAWRALPNCFGSCLFGTVDAAVMTDMAGLLTASTKAHAPLAMDVIGDGRAQGTMLPEAVGVATSFITEQLNLARASTRRLVILAPPNVASAALVGAVAFGGLSIEVLRATDLNHAALVLGRPELVPLMRALEAAIVEMAGAPTWLSMLRHALRADLERATPSEIARQLGISVRTLQRKLGERELSFHRELTEARVAVAAELLHATDDKLESIAIRAGFASRTSFARAFQRVRGESPDQYRRKR